MAKKTQNKGIAKTTKKAVTKSTAAKRGPSRGARAMKPVNDEEQRRRMISEAAYYIAEQRGFNGGDTVQDWLLAEAQIDNHLPPRK